MCSPVEPGRPIRRWGGFGAWRLEPALAASAGVERVPRRRPGPSGTCFPAGPSRNRRAALPHPGRTPRKTAARRRALRCWRHPCRPRTTARCLRIRLGVRVESRVGTGVLCTHLFLRSTEAACSGSPALSWSSAPNWLRSGAPAGCVSRPCPGSCRRSSSRWHAVVRFLLRSVTGFLGSWLVVLSHVVLLAGGSRGAGAAGLLTGAEAAAAPARPYRPLPPVTGSTAPEM